MLMASRSREGLLKCGGLVGQLGATSLGVHADSLTALVMSHVASSLVNWDEALDEDLPCRSPELGNA